jgi:hypothetical protein
MVMRNQSILIFYLHMTMRWIIIAKYFHCSSYFNLWMWHIDYNHWLLLMFRLRSVRFAHYNRECSSRISSAWYIPFFTVDKITLWCAFNRALNICSITRGDGRFSHCKRWSDISFKQWNQIFLLLFSISV